MICPCSTLIGLKETESERHNSISKMQMKTLLSVSVVVPFHRFNLVGYVSLYSLNLIQDSFSKYLSHPSVNLFQCVPSQLEKIISIKLILPI